MRDPRFTISDLRLHNGYWTAIVHRNGVPTPIDRKWGSWQALVPISDTLTVRREVPRFVAEALQDRVRPIEKREQRAAITTTPEVTKA